MGDFALAETMLCKENGNSHFKNERYLEAIECYNTALKKCPKGHECKAVLLKNRAACHLKLNDYSSALSDCTQSLQITPKDPKALYRRAQAYEGNGNLTDAFADLKHLLAINPKNKEANVLARKLTTTIKKHQDVLQSTKGMVGEMIRALGDPDTPQANVIMAVKNCAILSRERAGSDQLYEAGAVNLLLPLLDSTTPEVVKHVLQTFVGLCTGHKARAHALLQTVSLNKLSVLICHKHSDVGCSAVAVVKQIILSVCTEDMCVPRNATSALVVDADTVVLTPAIQMVFILLLSQSVCTVTRDHIVELLISTIKNDVVVSVYLKGGLVSKLLQLSAISSEDANETVGVSDRCRINISVALSILYQHCSVHYKVIMEEECKKFVISRLSKTGAAYKREAVTAIATLLQGVLEIGAKIFSERAALDEVLKMANSDHLGSQSVAVEALALAASNKERCLEIIKDGLPVLKKLVFSKDDALKVRALVGLCKLGAVGGSNINARLFAEGSGLKLENACRKFLVGCSQHSALYKWAVEGLAFLSLDAEVKEAFIASKEAIKVLCSVPADSEQSLLYGTVLIFVNLTNSYDKPEKNPELEELGKFAGENVPKEHVLDGEEYVRKRVSCLLKEGVVSGLVVLAGIESDAVHEQVARVFLALVEDTCHRGTVMQQGGVKSLLLLTNSNTSKGKLIASQALAKICITNDPKLAFSGQRLLEVIRPLVRLLKSDHGLQLFEALMALTNLASTTDDARQRIIKEGGVPLMESLMFEEHELIRRAATEALCNMIQVPEVHDRFFKDDIERVKLWTLFSGEDDIYLARAASGGLAQLTCDPTLCSKVMEVKSAPVILKELLMSENEELRNRGTYIVANLIESSEAIATSFISSEILEILMAFVQDPSITQSVKTSASRALDKAIEFKLIQPNPQLGASGNMALPNPQLGASGNMALPNPQLGASGNMALPNPQLGASGNMALPNPQLGASGNMALPNPQLGASGNMALEQT